MRTLSLLGFFLCLSVCLPIAEATAAAPRFSTPVAREEIRQAYYTHSPVAIVAALTADGARQWRTIMQNVAAGDGDWIVTAMVYLAPGTDGVTTTDLKTSLALALSNNPLPVISHAAAGISLRDICSMPFIEPERAFLLRYGEATLRALAAVNEEWARPDRRICMNVLEESLELARALPDAAFDYRAR